MAQCPYCGAQNTNSKFCGQCGSQLAPTAPAPQAPRTNRTPWIIAGVAAALVLLLGGALVFLLGGSNSDPVRTVSGPAGQGGQGTPAPSGGGAGQSKSRLPSDPNNPLVGGYVHMRIPGVAYTQQAGDTLNLYVSSGAMTASSLLINPDGTYAWNSQWDGKIITGTWTKDGGDINLLHGQEGKDWRVTRSTANLGGDIVIMNGSIYYIADRARE
jgi:hypothetical protein